MTETHGSIIHNSGFELPHPPGYLVVTRFAGGERFEDWFPGGREGLQAAREAARKAAKENEGEQINEDTWDITVPGSPWSKVEVIPTAGRSAEDCDNH